MAEKGLVLSGARARLSINGTKVMYCYNVTYGEEITYEPIEPIDQLEVAEHVPTGYRVTFSAQWVRVITNAIKLRDGVAIMPRLENILANEEAGVSLSAVVEDRVTGTVLSGIQEVKASRYNINIGNRGIVLNDVEFVAIRIRDESEIVV